jgi:O-antigen ligase
MRFGLLLALLTAFFFSQSRGAFLSLMAAGGGLLLFGVWWRDYRTGARYQGSVPSAERRVAPWLLLTGLAAALWLSSSGLFGRLLPSELSDLGRMVTWRQTLAMWRDHWLFGIGNGSFEYVLTRYRVPAMDGKVYDFAHNDHLQLLAEQGVIGSALFYGVFGVCWFNMLRAYCRRGRSKSWQGVLLGIMIAVFAFFLHGFVDFNFHIPANALWFYALLGLGLVASTRIAGGGVRLK